MKTLAIFYPGCIEFEILLACEVLNPHFPVELATPDGGDHRGSNGLTFRPQLSFADVKAADYAVVLIPGGDPGSLLGNETLNGILREGRRNGAVLAAICAGPVLLEQAGLLKGRRIAHGYGGSQLEFLKERGHFLETQLTDEACIAGDGIVTARPDSFIDFAVETALMAGAFSRSKAGFWKDYYRGTAGVWRS